MRVIVSTGAIKEITMIPLSPYLVANLEWGEGGGISYENGVPMTVFIRRSRYGRSYASLYSHPVASDAALE